MDVIRHGILRDRAGGDVVAEQARTVVGAFGRRIRPIQGPAVEQDGDPDMAISGSTACRIWRWKSKEPMAPTPETPSLS